MASQYDIVAMTKTLRCHDNSQVLILEKPLMKALGIEVGLPLQMTVKDSNRYQFSSL